ncbi:aminotransferase class III-fold pyridoxal phosphate-dependent enzyme [Paracoccus caeni]|uniref:Aminotransferase class III-fold pyridoxal phosphate-dependent enzyme n=1 Tax=Paracoccus caeni TaxID=657651 RepID=A0A934SBW9_9RHOB|nr:aminotransferase class III-fold pyridoxal phosphate-dependent enzyme [Paracoccus caeni]MBK4215976.1 aminotransferase class III-fold pyridoxal phosphate-dependent enzyme [Paracoccus caeni]
MNALTPTDLPDIVSETVAAFAARTAGSKALAEQARPVLADKTPLSMPFSPALKEAYYPIVADRSEGAYLTDIDGNRYVDILMGLGCNLFGHNPAPIRQALEARLAQGIQIGPQSEIAAETAQRFAALTGHERVTFSTTGTEAVMTAIRLARATTGRRRIAVFTNSYHGHADTALFKAKRLEYIRRGALARAGQGPLKALRPLLERLMITGAQPGFAGIPAGIGGDIMVLDYANPRALDILRRKGRSLAAVLVEPVQSRNPELQPRDFLHELRRVTEATGTALIFDEMISGFRVAQGGAQEHFGVRADLATYGKIAGGGLPLSLIAGSARFMDRVDGGQWQFGDGSGPDVPTTMFAGTHARHPLSLTAALAAAKMLQEAGPELQQRLNASTGTLVERLNLALAGQGLAVRFTSFGSFFAIDGSASRMDPVAGPLLSLILLAGGLHLRPGDRGGFLSTAHGKEELDFIFTAFSTALDRLGAAGLIRRV